jgi:hypothetical protein
MPKRFVNEHMKDFNTEGLSLELEIDLNLNIEELEAKIAPDTLETVLPLWRVAPPRLA